MTKFDARKEDDYILEIIVSGSHEIPKWRLDGNQFQVSIESEQAYLMNSLWAPNMNLCAPTAPSSAQKTRS